MEPMENETGTRMAMTSAKLLGFAANLV